MEITLDQLLASREDRTSHQRELRMEYPGRTLICLTVIMPGKVKRNLQSLTVAQAALSALVNRFSDEMVHLETRDLPTGYEAYLLTSLSVEEAKRAVCFLEDTHPLGRLFDMDVIGEDGAPVSRQSVGSPLRRCLICGEEARFCMRNRTHTQEELMARIDEMIATYVQ